MKLSLILKENQTMSVEQKAAGSGGQIIMDGLGENSVEACMPSPTAPWSSGFAVNSQAICYAKVVSLDSNKMWY